MTTAQLNQSQSINSLTSDVFHSSSSTFFMGNCGAWPLQNRWTMPNSTIIRLGASSTDPRLAMLSSAVPTSMIAHGLTQSLTELLDHVVRQAHPLRQRLRLLAVDRDRLGAVLPFVGAHGLDDDVEHVHDDAQLGIHRQIAAGRGLRFAHVPRVRLAVLRAAQFRLPFPAAVISQSMQIDQRRLGYSYLISNSSRSTRTLTTPHSRARNTLCLVQVTWSSSSSHSPKTPWRMYRRLREAFSRRNFWLASNWPNNRLM